MGEVKQVYHGEDVVNVGINLKAIKEDDAPWIGE